MIFSLPKARTRLLASICLLGVLIGLSSLITHTFLTQTGLVVYFNPTGRWCFDVGAYSGKLEARVGRQASPPDLELLPVVKKDPLLNGLRIQKVCGFLGIHLWENYSVACGSGTAANMIDPSVSELVICVGPVPAILVCCAISVLLIYYRGRKQQRRGFPLPSEGTLKARKGVTTDY